MLDENKKTIEYKFIEGDTFELIKTVEDGTIDLTITSPPYNIGKVYEKRQKHYLA